MHVTRWTLLLPGAPPAEPWKVRQGRVLNKDPHTTCSLESQTTSSHVKSVHVTIAVSVMERT